MPGQAGHDREMADQVGHDDKGQAMVAAVARRHWLPKREGTRLRGGPPVTAVIIAHVISTDRPGSHRPAILSRDEVPT